MLCWWWRLRGCLVGAGVRMTVGGVVGRLFVLACGVVVWRG